MGVRGMDISNHQAGMDVERVVRENNVGFVFILSNDGAFKNPYYQSQKAAARRGGAIAVPYVYLRTNVDQTYETFRQQEPTPGPAIVDVEDGSGGRAECDRIHSRLHDDGYSTPLLYWPDWYRRKIGSPSLSGLPPLWTSWYPDYVNRGFDQGLAMVPAWVWNGYGGLPTRIVQFTSSGRLSGYGGNLDLNYFPGSHEELAALLGGHTSSGGGGADKELEMGTHLVRGADTGRCFVVEVSTQVRGKWYIPNTEVLEVLASLMGTTTRDVPDWHLDYIADVSGPAPVPVDVDEAAIASAVSGGVIPAVVAALQGLDLEGLSFKETVDAVREALRTGTNG